LVPLPRKYLVKKIFDNIIKMLTSNFQFIYIFSKFKTTKNWTELDGRSTIAEERLILRQYFMIHVITVILF